MEKEKFESKKIEDNDLGKVAGGYTPHTYYFSGSDENHAIKQGYISVSKEEYDLLKENNFINPYGNIDSRHADLALSFLREHNHPRDKVTDQDPDHIDLIIN